jgi:hypothetical protein
LIQVWDGSGSRTEVIRRAFRPRARVPACASAR